LPESASSSTSVEVSPIHPARSTWRATFAIYAPVVAVLAAACCWGALGIAFELILDRYTVGRITLLAIRAMTAGAIMLAYVTLRPDARRHLAQLRQPRAAITALFGGLVATTAFYVALIYSYREAGVAVGIVLLYLAPALVTIASRVTFGHAIDTNQRLALGLAFFGVLAISGVLGGAGDVSLAGIALGLASAGGYASYSISGTILLARMPPSVVVAVVLGIGSVGLWAVAFAAEGVALPSLAGVVVIASTVGIGSTLLPMLLYTWGMQRLGPPRASVIATAEPVVGVLLAFAILGESLTGPQIVGATLVVMSLVIAASHRRSTSVPGPPLEP
jgi:drug/metabolite transporter (DMT)-like permease